MALLLAAPARATLRVAVLAEGAELGLQAPTSFGMDASGAVLLRAGGGLFDLGAKKPLVDGLAGGVLAHAVSGGRVLFVAEGWLQAFEKGRTSRVIEVPFPKALMAADAATAWIAAADAEGRVRLFAYAQGKGFRHALDLPELPGAMALAADTLLFTLGPALCALGPDGALRIEAVLPGFTEIRSLAVDEARGVVYLSDGRSVYALLPKTGKVVLVFGDAGGELAYVAGGLALLTVEPAALYRIEGLSEELAAEPLPAIPIRALARRK